MLAVIMERAHRLNEQARGVYVISATPFSDDGAVDLDSTDRLIDFYLDKGVSGITILGMMGEAPKLTAAESRSVVQRVLKRVAGRVPVVVGVTNAGTDNLVALSRSSMDAGAAGVMVAPLSSLRHEQEVVDYFETLAGRLGDDIPICYQDYPQATGVHISTATFLRLVEALPSVVMLKHETCPGLRTITAIRAESERAGLRRVSILCGNGGLYLPLELGRGADGAMTGFAYPEMLVQLCSGFAPHATGRDRDAAEDLFDAYLPLVRYEQQPGFGLAIRKEILRRRGAITSARTRTPGPAMNADDSRELDRLIQRVEARLEA